ncbi:MAG TPA: tetratricopeptide repeat protein [Arenimonas sp.]|uniref:tetratricopeptide repeat protein n=1 Tax=Arenimonas sp. TaxID=1872635 RepID=UPI002D80659A|nr:tetratricopeptide repeat protein [Arenimonas sp.]HEU0153499.1 tetratricopeptide repeat protein [Arenimonas sp.]
MSSIERLQSFLATDPSNPELLCELADAMFAIADYTGAQAVLMGAPAAIQASLGIRFRLARYALIHGDYAAAEAGFKRLTQDGHANPALWHDLAFSQLCQLDTGGARATLEAAVARSGDTPELAVLRARVALRDQDYASAELALGQALTADSQHPVALGLRALASLDKGDTSAAEAYAKDCLTLHPDQHEALLVAGTAALWRRELGPAGAAFERVLARHPNSGRALSGFGQLQMLREQLEPARATLERAVAAMPDHIGTWHALAWAQLMLGDTNAAEASYRCAYELDRNFAESHGGLGLIAALAGRSDEADAAIKRALRLDPSCITARYARSLQLEDVGEHAEAERLLSELLAQGALPSGVGNVREFSRRLRARLGASSRA